MELNKHILMFFSLLAAMGLAGQSCSSEEAKPGRRDASSKDATAGSIAADTEIIGVTVINGELYIDGDRVAAGVATFKGKRSGKTYFIKWGKDGNVSVAEK